MYFVFLEISQQVTSILLKLVLKITNFIDVPLVLIQALPPKVGGVLIVENNKLSPLFLNVYIFFFMNNACICNWKPIQ